MSSIRKCVYAALLAATSVILAPSPASAQDARGTFKLAHDVHWENALVPAGDYKFSLESDGVGGVLTLSKMDGRRVGFLLLVHDSEQASVTGPSHLVLAKTAEGSYVSAMQLAEAGLTLRFPVPNDNEKQMAKAVTAASPSEQ
jgi:hypothetical protein